VLELDTLSFFVVVHATLYHVRVVASVSVVSLGQFNRQYDAISPIFNHINLSSDSNVASGTRSSFNGTSNQIPMFDLFDQI
jgi:hypothetical protein